jgi:glycosidase
MKSLYDPEVISALEAWETPAGAKNPPKAPATHAGPGDWRDNWIYFILVDRFDNPSSPPRYFEPSEKYQGGNFAGITRRLDYIKKLGAGAIWLSPVTANPPWFDKFWGGYAAYDFLHIEPRFCSDPAAAAKDPDLAAMEFRALVDAAHAKGLSVILDIVLNHAGNLFSYEGMGDEAPFNRAGRYPIRWKDGQGVARKEWEAIENLQNLTPGEGIWPEELQCNCFFRRRGKVDEGGGITEGDFGSLKEFDTGYVEEGTHEYRLRNALIRIYQYFIARFDIDGYRIDTLQYVEEDFARTFGNAMREYALSIGKTNFFTFGEVWQDDDEAKIARFVGRDTTKGDEIIGVDAAIDFPMRRRLWDVCKGFAPPAQLAAHFDNRRETLKKIVSSHGEAGSHYVTFLDNHDLNERFHNPGWDGQTKVALTCLMTMQGIPCLYYGTENGLSGHGDTREYVREAFWGMEGAFHSGHELYRQIQELSRIRRLYPALRYGRQYFRKVSGNGVDFGYSPYRGGVIAYSRILNDREILVVANTCCEGSEPVSIHVMVDKNLHPFGRSWQCLFSSEGSKPKPKITVQRGDYHTVEVSLAPMEAQILA